jgi:FeS assembly SUF system regulator
MIRLTNLADYAVVLMCHIAAKPGGLHSAFALSGATGIPVPTVSKILGALARADLLASQRGINGGFALNQSVETITVAGIIEAVDGPIALTNCVEGSVHECNYEAFCSTKRHWVRINNAVKGALASVRLSEISVSVEVEAAAIEKAALETNLNQEFEGTG